MFTHNSKNKRKVDKLDALDSALEVGELAAELAVNTESTAALVDMAGDCITDTAEVVGDIAESAVDTVGDLVDESFDLLDALGDTDDIPVLAIVGVLAALVSVGIGIVKLITHINKKIKRGRLF